MTQILLVLLTAALGASLVAGEMRTRQARGERDEIREVYEDTRNELIEAERNLERTTNELESWKQLLNRPLVATLSDAQANSLTQAVLAYLASSAKAPEQLN